MLTQRKGAWPWFTTLLLAACLVSSLPGADGLRQMHVGDIMPEFSLADPNGTIFHYGPGRVGVLGIVILQTKQANLERQVADLETLAQTLKCRSGPSIAWA